MTPEEGERIYSNDYADLIIKYGRNMAIFNKFKDATIQIIDNFFAIVRIPRPQITENTISELGYYVMPTLSGIISQASLDASGIDKVPSIPPLNLRGKGVLIGIIDTGIDYTNPIFQNTDHTTKIAALWDQTIYGVNYSSNTYYGTEYSREQLNEALKSDTPYAIVPSKDEVGHGTMLAAIAAGNEMPEHNFYGIAPEAELVVVKLKPAKPYLKEFWRIPVNAICYQENDILSALQYLEDKATKWNRPMSICLALGTSLVSHTGVGPLSHNLSLRAENINYSIVVAAGNEGNAKRHYEGTIDPKIGFDKVALIVGEKEEGFSMELWGNPPGLFSVEIQSPTGEHLEGNITSQNEKREFTFLFEQTKLIIDSQIVESQSGDPLILFRFTNPTPGIWNFTVYGNKTADMRFHIWLPMEGFLTKDTFFTKSNPDTTILSLGNSDSPISVTAYDSQNSSIYLNASRGYTRSGDIKPDVAAPGVNIVVPTLNQGFTECSGTSLAAAHTAGVAAMILEWGIVRGNLPLINTEDVKILMIRGAKRLPNVTYPNKEWGYGMLHAFNIFNSLRGIK